MVGALARTNQEIRWHIEAAMRRRVQRRRLIDAMHCLDQIIGSLEELHLEGHSELPARLLPRLDRLLSALPTELHPLRVWPSSIMDAIEQCFSLQEQLLARANPARVHLIALDDLIEAESDEPELPEGVDRYEHR